MMKEIRDFIIRRKMIWQLFGMKENICNNFIIVNLRFYRNHAKGMYKKNVLRKEFAKAYAIKMEKAMMRAEKSKNKKLML